MPILDAIKNEVGGYTAQTSRMRNAHIAVFHPLEGAPTPLAWLATSEAGLREALTAASLAHAQEIQRLAGLRASGEFCTRLIVNPAQRHHDDRWRVEDPHSLAEFRADGEIAIGNALGHISDPFRLLVEIEDAMGMTLYTADDMPVALEAIDRRNAIERTAEITLLAARGLAWTAKSRSNMVIQEMDYWVATQSQSAGPLPQS